MSIRHDRTVWEKLGAIEGLWAAILLSIQAFILAGADADPAATDAAFVTALLAERAAFEWVTFLRIVAGLMIVWWMGSLAGRLRLAEGEPGRLAKIAFGVGAAWGFVWLLSALFNSAAILFAANYANPAASRAAATLAIEAAYVLSPAMLVVLTFAVALVGARFGGFPAWYTWGTWIASGALLALAIVDWYGAGTLSVLILGVGIAWMAITSVMLVGTYQPPDLLTGAKGRVAS